MALPPVRSTLWRSGTADPSEPLPVGRRVSGIRADGGCGTGEANRTDKIDRPSHGRDHFGGTVPAGRLYQASLAQPELSGSISDRCAAAHHQAAVRVGLVRVELVRAGPWH